MFTVRLLLNVRTERDSGLKQRRTPTCQANLFSLLERRKQTESRDSTGRWL